MSKTKATKRLLWIDGVKGLAILGIVLFHFFQSYPNSLFLVKFLDLHLPKIGFAMVDVFFLVSGFNTSYSLVTNRDRVHSKPGFWKNWLKKRLLRIYPTYWLAIAYICVLSYLFGLPIRVNSLWQVLAIAIGVPDYNLFKLINPGFWFISVLIQAYFIIPVLLSWAIDKPRKILIIGFIGAVVNKLVCFILGYQSDYTSFGYYFFLQTNFLGSYFFPLCLGLYWGIIFQQGDRFRKQDWQGALILFGSAIAFQLLLNINNIDLRYKLGLDIFVVPLLTLILYAIAKNDFPIKIYRYFKSIIGNLGRNSYPIYLIHQPIFFIFISFWLQRFKVNPYLSLLLVAIAVTITLTLLLHLFMKIDLYLFKLIKRLFPAV